jgi:hypothetical protein
LERRNCRGWIFGGWEFWSHLEHDGLAEWSCGFLHPLFCTRQRQRVGDNVVQQTDIQRAVMIERNHVYKYWQIGDAILGLVLFLLIFCAVEIFVLKRSIALWEWFGITAMFLVIQHFQVSARLRKRSQNKTP